MQVEALTIRLSKEANISAILFCSVNVGIKKLSLDTFDHSARGIFVPVLILATAIKFSD